MPQEWESEPGDVETKIIPHIEDANLKLFFYDLKQNELFINYNITYYVRTESFRLQPIKKSSIFLKFKPDLDRDINNIIIITLNEPAPSNDSKFEIEHIVYTTDIFYEKFETSEGMKEVVVKRFEHNSGVAPTSALAWNAMDRLLDLLAQ
jgi:hypothetical protein